MRVLIVGALVAALAGCASNEDLRKKDPVFFATTQKAPADYAACVMTSWRQLEDRVTQEPIRNGFDLVVRSRFDVEEVLRVQHYDGVTHLNMYARTRYKYQELMQAANLCVS